METRLAYYHAEFAASELEITAGEGQRVTDMIAKAPPGPIKTKWGIAFRDYDECVTYIRQSNSIKAPPGGVALPLP